MTTIAESLVKKYKLNEYEVFDHYSLAISAAFAAETIDQDWTEGKTIFKFKDGSTLTLEAPSVECS